MDWMKPSNLNVHVANRTKYIWLVATCVWMTHLVTTPQYQAVKQETNWNQSSNFITSTRGTSIPLEFSNARLPFSGGLLIAFWKAPGCKSSTHPHSSSLTVQPRYPYCRHLSYWFTWSTKPPRKRIHVNIHCSTHMQYPQRCALPKLKWMNMSGLHLYLNNLGINLNLTSHQAYCIFLRHFLNEDRFSFEVPHKVSCSCCSYS